MARKRKLGTPHKTWDHRLWFAAFIADEEGGEAEPDDINVFRRQVDASPTLQSLLGPSSEKRRQYRLCVRALFEAGNLPWRRLASFLFPDTKETRGVIKRTVAGLEAAARHLKRAGITDLERECLVRAERGRRYLRPRMAGTRSTIHGNVIRSLDYWLTDGLDIANGPDDAWKQTPPKLSTKGRHRLIAAIVTDFVQPMNTEQVRQHLRVPRKDRDAGDDFALLRYPPGVTLLEAAEMLPRRPELALTKRR